MRLEGKICVVTGASSGMGKRIAEMFAAEGAKVVAVARRLDRLEALAASAAGAPGELAPFAGDVGRKEDNAAMIDFAVQRFGGLDVLVNNAGIMDDMGPVGEMNEDMLENVFRVDVYGPLLAMKKAVQAFKAQGRGGSVINVTSAGARIPLAGVVYCAAKAALSQATRESAFMYMPDGIRFNAIAPGGVATEIAGSMGQPNMNGYGRVNTLLQLGVPMATVDDIAYAAAYLASDESAGVTGVVLGVDGGYSAL